MRKSINFLFFSLLLFSIKGIAQEKVDYQFIDSITYRYYLEKNWKELVDVSKTGLKNDIDYYYLRMRTGIAYFEQGNYLKAEKQFKKALHLIIWIRKQPTIIFTPTFSQVKKIRLNMYITNTTKKLKNYPKLCQSPLQTYLFLPRI